MNKFLLVLFLVIISVFVNESAHAQIDVPKWVDDIGSSNSNCISSGVQVDKQNNVYITGFFNGTADFDPSSATYNLTAKGVFDAFVAKYTTDGKFIWAISIGGSGTTQVNSLAVDKDGNPVISGQFDSNNLDADPGLGVTTLSTQGGNDAFVIKFSTTNGALVWAKSIGGVNTDYGGHVSTDSQGNVVECVRYQATVTVGTKSFTAGGSDFNGLTVKYDPSGNLLWAININDSGRSESDYSGVDSQNNIVVTGHFDGNDNFNPLATSVTLNGNGNGIYVAKYTSAGILQWVKGFNGSVAIVCVDSKNDIYVDGPYSGTTTFGTSSINSIGSQDLFLAKYSSAGDFLYARDIGGAGSSVTNYGILASQDNTIYISGYFSGTIDFDPSPATTALLTYHGQQDFFLAKYDENLNYKYAFNAGNAECSSNLGRALGIDNNNAVLFTGGFCSTVDFSGSSCTPYPLTAQSSSRDCFLGKYIQNTATTTAEITAFSIPQQTAAAVIDQTNLKITVTVPSGTDISALVPTITYTSGVTLTPASGTAQNFTGGVTYKLSTSCTSLNYAVNVVFSATAKPLTVCPDVTTALTGDTENPVPNSYIWQLLQNNVWVNAPGTNNGKDYQVTLSNNTNANVVYSLRRQTTTGTIIAYDSYYDLTVLPAITNNTITAPAVSSFCTSGDPANIVGSVPTGGTGTYTYQWQSSTDGNTFTNISGATGSDYDPPLLTTTTYYARVLTSGTCTSTKSNIITISILSPPSPPASFTQAVCTGNTATLSLTGVSQGPNIYNWYTSAARSTLLFTGTTYVTGAINENTTYYVEAVNGGCSSTTLATVQVNVNPLPAAPIVANTTLQTCSGSQVTLNITNPQNGYSYVWYAAATGGIPVFTGTTFVVSSPTATISYYAEAVSNSGCTSAARTEVDITVIQLPSPPQVETPLAVCSGSPATLTVSDPQADLTYKWYNVATGGTPLITGTQYNTPLLTANATYYVEATSNTGGCISAARTQVTVTVTPLPAAPASIVQQTCTGSQATLTIADPQNSITYNWYDSAAKTNLLYSGVSYTTGFINTNTTFYVEAVNGTCPATSLATAQVNVIPLPAAPAVISNVIPTCYGTQVTFNINNPQQGFTYNWYTTGTGGNTVFTGTSFTTPTLTTNTTYYAEAVNSNSCASSRTAVNAVIIPTADVTAQGAAICPGTSATLTATSQNPDATFDWYDAATGGTKLFSGSSFTTPALTANTTYYAQVMNAAGCVVSTRAKAVVTILTQLATPVVTVGSTSPTSITFDWTAVPGALGYLVSIDGGATYTTPSSGSSGTEQIISNLQLGQSITILVEATSVSECQLSGSSTAVTAIAQYPQNDIVYIPNAFTPNGDGKNDVVFVHGNNIRSLTFSIYDQWGELIFRSSNQAIGWDGTFKGSRQPVGVYVYYVQAILNTGTNVNKKGTITLLR